MPQRLDRTHVRRAESSESALGARVDSAIASRRERQGERKNGELSADDLDRFAAIGQWERTVANLEGEPDVGTPHLAQALALRAELG